jgi:hypothetical protein
MPQDGGILGTSSGEVFDGSGDMEELPTANKPPRIVTPGSDPGVVIKNTFLEVGDHKSLLERSEGWRRQMSEPVKIYMSRQLSEPVQLMSGTQQDSLSELDEDEEFLEGSKTPELATMAASSSTAGEPAYSSVAPQVLLLSETIPPARKYGALGSKNPAMRNLASKKDRLDPGIGKLAAGFGPDRDRKEAHSKEAAPIHPMKDIDITKKEPPWTDVTTVMMRNLPNKYSQQMLLEELQDAGFQQKFGFDFFYLPMDHSNSANLGYCFINFVDPAMANAFAAAFQGKKMRRFNSHKTVVVMPASIQGLDRNYVYYSSTRVAQNPQYRPLFLRHPEVDAVALPGLGAAGCGGGAPPSLEGLFPSGTGG